MRIEDYPREQIDIEKHLHKTGSVQVSGIAKDTDVFMVTSGAVGVGFTNKYGRRFISEILQPGEVFRNDESLIKAEIIPVRRNTELKVFQVPEFDPEVQEALWETTMQRIRKGDQKRYLNRYGQSPNIVAHALLEIADDEDMVTVSHKLLSQYAGVSRERVTKNVGVFKKEGLIKPIRAEEITILEREQLARIAENL